jgi:hypothetical protein
MPFLVLLNLFIIKFKKFMEIKKINSVTKTDEIVITKGIANLVIMCTEDFSFLNDERISVWVEKASGNQDICRGVLLRDFIVLGTYGEDIVQHGFYDGIQMMTIANIELTEDSGFIQLGENETIKFQLSDLDADSGVTYALVGIEGVNPSTNLRRYERKVISSNSVSQDYDLKGYDLMSLQKHNSVESIDFYMDNGSVVKMTPFELETIQKSIDPFQAFKKITTSNGVQIIPVHELFERISFPLIGVNRMTIRKSVGTNIGLHLRIDANDYLQYGHNLN